MHVRLTNGPVAYFQHRPYDWGANEAQVKNGATRVRGKHGLQISGFEREALMGTSWDLERLAQEWTARGLDRRDLFKMIATGGAGMAIATLLGSPVAGAAAARQEATGGDRKSVV